MPEFTLLGFISGSIAGAVGLLIGYPLDTLKVRAQVGKADVKGPGGLAGLKELYRGSLTPTVTAGALQCVNFGVYENIARAMSATGTVEGASLYDVTVAGAAGGVAISVFTCPQQRIKIHQQLLGGTLVSCAKDFYRAKGIIGFYRAYSLHVIMEACRGFYMATYVGTKRFFHAGSDDTCPLAVRMLAGASAGTIGWCIVYPFDACKAVLQADRAGATRFTSVYQCAHFLYQEGGLARFFRGFGYTILRAGPVAAALLPTYDVTLRLLSPYFPPSAPATAAFEE